MNCKGFCRKQSQTNCKSNTILPVSRPRFEPRTWTQCRNTTYSLMTLIYHLMYKTQTIRINEKKRKVQLLLLLKAWRECRCTPFLTLTLDGGEWSTSLPRYSTLGKEMWCLFNRKLVWTLWRRDKSLAPAQIRTPDCPAHILVTRLDMLSQLK